MRESLLKVALCIVTALLVQPVHSQSGTSDGPVRGPFFSGTVRAPKSNEAIAMKGIVVTVGSEKNAYICYDTDLMRVSMGWTGAFLEFGDTLNKIAWPPPPQVKGEPKFSTRPNPGWAKGDSLADPRERNQGPLPKDWAHYKGLYQSGDRVTFKYTVGSTEVLESPGYQNGIFERTLTIAPSRSPMTLAICNLDAAPDLGSASLQKPDDKRAFIIAGNQQKVAVGFVANTSGSRFTRGADDLRLEIPAHAKPFLVKILIASVASEENAKQFATAVQSATAPEDLAQFTKGGPARWTETVTTKGTLGSGDEAYLVDTITEPVQNPYNARTFFGGFDFLNDGRAAICTFHGDVWLVDGIDADLDQLKWKRFATGLFQPLGLKVVNNTIYVLGRDQITRLHDLNKDDEADFFENFNNDTVVTSNYHEYCLDLHTDRQGNFYFAKGAPWEPEVTSPHQGCMIKVSKDGSKMEVIASGLRAPNGMTVGPDNQITVSDNQGHWMPSSKLNWVEKNGFYGMLPTAQRDLKLTLNGNTFTANPSDPKQRAEHKFKGWDNNSPMPENYDQPLCWLPMNMDNSSGGQVWVTSKKWGPFNGQLLFMSYGKCTLFEVMIDEVDGVRNAAMIQFPFKFNSGVMRARFNPKDGQLYLCGLKGWQSSATRDGGFYRVRHTDKPVHMPSAFKATETGIQLTFTSKLDAASAADAANYSAERWNYKYSGGYGSPEFSVSDPTQRKHDKLEITKAVLSKDGKSVFLEIQDMKPSDQLKIKYAIDAASSEMISQEIYATVHKLARNK
ncbi:MAG: DUF6797 domain-containing protein [Verrucomicrobiota bacterium]|nr:DUF6797 domain-containing protein [Verrucomicrobiota bacterium]